MQKINHNISSYNNLLDILDNIKFNCPTLDYNITVNKITQYNKKLSSISEEVSKNNGEIEKFVQSMAFLDVSEYISINNLEKVESENTESEEKKEKPKDILEGIDILNTTPIEALNILYKLKENK